jgi:RNA polymerase sigma-70 factor (ECF subfamily)
VTFEGRSGLESWVYSFCRHTLREFERIGARQTVDALPESSEVGPTAQGHEESQRLLASLDRLDPPLADVICLRHFEQLTFPDIAARRGLPASTVKSRYYRGIERLRFELSRKGSKPG